MPLSSVLKQLSIAAGLYRPARWLSQRLRPGELQSHLGYIAFYRSLLAPRSLCFDVGANIGENSEAMLEAGLRVVALEPNPMVLPELRARCKHFGDCKIVEAALGSAVSTATLHAARSHGQSSLVSDWASDVIATYDVPVLTLDHVIETFGAPAYCKIDVEGWESEVLKGLTRAIPLISFEFHLNDADIRRTVSCLNRLTELGASHVNLTPAEGFRFHFSEWMPLPEFREWFPGDLRRTLPGDSYGDIFVRSDAAQPGPLKTNGKD
jgi:FkbM family methyltransferase